MSSYRQINRASRARTLDRDTWAGNTVVVTALDIDGSGEQSAQLVEFGLVFDGAPMFTYGAELVEGQSLVVGDFPFVSCGVSAWVTLSREGLAEETYYTGAYVWVNIVSRSIYRLRLRAAFEGIAFKSAGRFD